MALDQALLQTQVRAQLVALDQMLSVVLNQTLLWARVQDSISRLKFNLSSSFRFDSDIDFGSLSLDVPLAQKLALDLT